MRKDKNIRYGFTMAELMISMLITMVILTAMVPIIGPKKITRTFNRPTHGIYECFYGGNGPRGYFDGLYPDGYYSLRSYSADAKNSKGTTLYLSSKGASDDIGSGLLNAHKFPTDHCTFYPPKADYFQIYVIGAGGSGVPIKIGSSVGDSVDDENSSFVPKYSGVIRVDNNFQSDIDAVGPAIGDETMPGKIRNAIKRWSLDAVLPSGAKYNNDLKAVYTKITSPIARGGKGMCKAHVYKNYGSKCYELCQGDGMTCPGPYTYYNGTNMISRYDGETGLSNIGYDKCWFYIRGAGGSSGQQLESFETFKFRLYDTTDIDLYTINPNPTNEDDIYKTRVALTYAGVTKFVELEAPKPGADAEYNSDYGYFATTPQVGTDLLSLTYPDDAKCTSEGASDGKAFCDKLKPNGIRGTGPSDGDGHGATKECTPRAGSSAQPGVIEYTQDAIKWVYKTWKRNLKYGPKGENGEIKSYTTQKINGPLYLFPAKSASTDSVTNYSTVSYNEDGSNPFIMAKSGKSAKGVVTLNNYVLTGDNIPYSKELVEKSTVNNEEKMAQVLGVISSSPYKGGLYDCYINPEKKYDPYRDECRAGFATSGWYPYIFGSNDDEFILTDNQAQGSNSSYTITIPKASYSNSATYNCADGEKTDKSTYLNNYQYCLNEKNYGVGDGNMGHFDTYDHVPGRGAIIIVW